MRGTLKTTTTTSDYLIVQELSRLLHLRNRGLQMFRRPSPFLSLAPAGAAAALAAICFFCGLLVQLAGPARLRPPLSLSESFLKAATVQCSTGEARWVSAFTIFTRPVERAHASPGRAEYRGGGKKVEFETPGCLLELE